MKTPKILRNKLIDFLVAFTPVIGMSGLESHLNTASAYETPVYQAGQKPAPAPAPKPKGSNEDNKLEIKIERPKYHPSIEDYEKQLEREIGSWVPTYYEFGEFSDSKVLKEKFDDIRKNPKSVQSNRFYREFLKHMDYHYKNPDKENFLGYGLSLSELLEVRGEEFDLKKELGFSFSLKNLKENDKATLFLFWLNRQKDGMIEKNEQNLFYRVLDEISKSGKMPLKNYKDNKFLHLEFRPYVAQYESDVDVRRESRKPMTLAGNGLLKGYDTTTIFGSVEPVITDSINEELLNKWAGLIGEKEIRNLPPLPTILSDGFYLGESKKINLGMFFPNKIDRGKIKNAGIELYNPKGEKIKSWNFKVDESLQVEQVDLEKIVRNNGFGNYNSAFYINDKCWNVRQFEVRY